MSTHAFADTVHFTLSPSGALQRLAQYRPQVIQLSNRRPAGIRKQPDDLKTPRYGVLKLGDRTHQETYNVILDEAPDGNQRLFVDTDGNGDLTDDPPVVWKAKDYQSMGANCQMYRGSGSFDIHYGTNTQRVDLGFYRFDPNDTDPRRMRLKNYLVYYADYSYNGMLTLGNRPYRAMLADLDTTGDFRGSSKGADSGIFLLIDLNNNGRFDPPAEFFDITKPFNVGGTTYEIANMSPSGDSFDIVKSDKTVAPTTPDDTLEIGKVAPSFDTVTIDGKARRFPADYRGKMVLLYFWSTSSDSTSADMPVISTAYRNLQRRGLEVLGVCVDAPDMSAKIQEMTGRYQATWPEIYIEKSEDSEIIKGYNVVSLPRLFLVDADNGKIMAEGDALRGDALNASIDKALKAIGR
jgi:peroxiredoxin